MRVTTKQECECAATALGLSDTTALEYSRTSYPPYCILTSADGNDELPDGLGFNTFVNQDVNETPTCKNTERCICKESGEMLVGFRGQM